MIDPCDCCEGTEDLTPASPVNRPGLSRLAYRVGRHATFLQTMKAQLARSDLAGLQTREADDPSIALLDGWATVAHVLAFYQERIANEGYLRTATERRSILELARLIGYKLRPGVSASVYLAFSMETGYDGDIPQGTRAQSLPGPGELPQSFESAEPVYAQADWNLLKPRTGRPQLMYRPIVEAKQRVYVKGSATNVAANDMILIDYGDGDQQVYRVLDTEPDQPADRTRIDFEPWTSGTGSPGDATPITLFELQQLVDELSQAAQIDQFNLCADEHPLLALYVEYVYTLRDELQALIDSEPDEATLGETVKQLIADIEAEYQAKAADLEPPETVSTDWRSWLRVTGQVIARLKATLPEDTTAALSTGAPVFSVSQPFEHAAIIRQREGPPPLPTTVIGQVAQVLNRLNLAPSLQPRSPARLSRTLSGAFSAKNDNLLRTLSVTRPRAGTVLYDATRHIPGVEPGQAKVFVFRQRASVFGHNAPDPLPVKSGDNIVPQPLTALSGQETNNVLWLDNAYDKILPGSRVVIEKRAPDIQLVVATAFETKERSRADYGVSGKSTRLALSADWINTASDTFDVVRDAAIFAQSEELELVEMPVTNAVCRASIELDNVFDGLEAGRWVIVAGERTDVGVPGVPGSELVMLADVEHSFEPHLPGDTPHTRLTFATALAYAYKQGTVAVHGNVVRATHGETRSEVLGSGDGAKTFQQFKLRQSPLTYVSAPTPSGVESTLGVRVNTILWHEVDHLAGSSPDDRVYSTTTDDEAKTSVQFGDGRQGARPPSGAENIQAVYRTGIGKPGNVTAGKISLLATRPLGVKGVTNPLRASGGADRESRDQARSSAPLAVMALDRLVSVQDYADFARTFAGIGKASAAKLSDGTQEFVHLTIAGADDIPIDTTSDLYRNLLLALNQFGDPNFPFRVQLRELLILFISARVKLMPDYEWEAVLPQIRAQLLDVFGFEHRDLGQDVTLAEVISTIQAVPGVEYVDVDKLDRISETITPEELETLAGRLGLQKRIVANLVEVTTRHDVQPDDTWESVAELYGINVQTLWRWNDLDLETLRDLYQPGDPAYPAIPPSVTTLAIPRTFRPAQLAYLVPTLPETLILNEIPS